MSFRFVDLFSGIGGFHAALSAAGGECVYAVENDENAAYVYEKNWGINPLGDLTHDASEEQMLVPEHDVLCAGFPCQPFSKSGLQKGMDETRGTLYWNILRVIEARRPAVVLLENVRNLAGPRHRHEWQVIIETLRSEGYRVSETPAIFSPHLLSPERGGRPHARERVFITASRVPKGKGFELEARPAVTNRPVDGWDPMTWDLITDLPLEDNEDVIGCELSDSEKLWIEAWADFVQLMQKDLKGRRLPGFPIWADEWKRVAPSRLKREPEWKADFLKKNESFYFAHQRRLDSWAQRWGVYTEAFPPSRRKFEWQAQDTSSLWDAVMHFRPSGLRAKAPTYLPALVAINHASIIGPRRRRLSIREASRLQGLPEWFDFGDQTASSTYRQLGNGVSVGAVWHVLRSHVERDHDILKWTAPKLLDAVLSSPVSPDHLLNRSPERRRLSD